MRRILILSIILLFFSNSIHSEEKSTKQESPELITKEEIKITPSSKEGLRDKQQNKKSADFWNIIGSIGSAVSAIAIFILIWQIVIAKRTNEISLVTNLRDKFCSEEMVKVRKEIKSKENLEVMKDIRDGKIKDIKIYDPKFIPNFIILDFFETLGMVYKKEGRHFFNLICPIFGADVIFHYVVHKSFYELEELRKIYPERLFENLSKKCLERRGETPTIEKYILMLEF
jgi:hypothetical protein